jgi:hypothetical protein
MKIRVSLATTLKIEPISYSFLIDNYFNIYIPTPANSFIYKDSVFLHSDAGHSGYSITLVIKQFHSERKDLITMHPQPGPLIIDLLK